jgi:hypothetical protein
MILAMLASDITAAGMMPVCNEKVTARTSHCAGCNANAAAGMVPVCNEKTFMDYLSQVNGAVYNMY